MTPWARRRSPATRQAGHPPSLGDAFAVWVLGTLWAALCLWLGRVGLAVLVPVVLAGGFLSLWGWRSTGWLDWFPLAALAATLLDGFAPLVVPGAKASLPYLDLAVLGAMMISFARALSLGRLTSLGPGRWGLVAVAFAFAIVLATSRGRAPVALVQQIVIGVSAFLAAAALARRPAGARRVWTVFPVAAALLGAHAVLANMWGALAGTIGPAADRTIASTALPTLVLAVPVCIGLACSAGRLRVAIGAGAALGIAGVWLHLQGDAAAALLERLPRGTALLTTLATALPLVALGVAAWSVRVARPQEAPRWTALAVTLILMGPAVAAAGSPLGETPALLLSLSGGLAVGAFRHGQRSSAAAARRARAESAAAPSPPPAAASEELEPATVGAEDAA